MRAVIKKTKHYYKYTYSPFVQPALASNGNFYGSSMAVDISISQHSSDSGISNLYTSFYPNSSQFNVYANEYFFNESIHIYVPDELRLTNFSFKVNHRYDSSGPSKNTKLYGGNFKGDTSTLLLDIGDVAEREVFQRNLTTNQYFRYFTLYAENGAHANNDSLEFADIKLQGEIRTPVPGTKDDCDLIIIKGNYYSPKISNKYYGMNV